MKKLLLLILLLHSSFLFSQKSAIITGQVNGFIPNSIHVNVLRIYLNEAASADSEQFAHYAHVKDDGHFRFEITHPYPFEGSFFYGNQATLVYTEPGDSIFISFEADSLGSVRPFKNLEYSGDNQRLHELILQYRNVYNIYDSSYMLLEMIDSVPNPMEYYPKALEYLKEGRAHLRKFVEENQAGDKFYRIMLDNNDYSWAANLTLSSIFRRQQDSLPPIPESFYSFLDEININKPQSLHNSEYLTFIQYLVGSEIMKRKGKGKIKMMLTMLRPHAYYRMLKKLGLKGYGMDVGFGMMTYNMVGDHDARKLMKHLRERYYKLYMKKATFEPYKKTIDRVYHTKPQPNTEKTVTGSLADIIAPYEGKIVYIDFWASWCGPCMDQMPIAAEVKKQYSEDDIVFLYCSFDDSEDRWINARDGMKISGEHIRLSPKARTEISQQLNITGIPHYALINHKGEIFMESAPRPGMSEGNGKQRVNKQLEFYIKMLIQQKDQE